MPAKKSRKPTKKKSSSTSEAKVKAQESKTMSSEITDITAEKKAARSSRSKSNSKKTLTKPSNKPRKPKKRKTSATTRSKPKAKDSLPISTDKPRKNTQNKSFSAAKGKASERYTRLFSDIEILSTAEPADSVDRPCNVGEKITIIDASLDLVVPESDQQRRELEILRARVLELEAKLKHSNNTISAPVLYEKDRVGFVYKEDTLVPLKDPNLNPDSDGEDILQAPLTASGQSIGSMFVHTTQEQSWDPEEENLAISVAQQASLQIQSLRLLASAERARAEAEEATRRFMHEGYDSYLDAIHQKERIGYAYDQASVTPFIENADSEIEYRDTVEVMDEQVGTIGLKNDPAKPLTESDKTLISSVASQIAQQVENIRLLADAARARAEAEEATRRLTRESWQDYKNRRDGESHGFAYDTVQVSPLGDSSLPGKVALTLPLEVRGEEIGQLAIAGESTLSPEQHAMAEAIATQASTHLETLRLAEELQQRAEELQELDRLKSGFLANMSHELRTPLNSILGFADVMLLELDGPLTPEMNNDLELIQKNGQHLLHLINDVLDMAKIESGHMNLTPERFKVHDVLDEVNSITSTLASERNISLFIDKDSDQEVEIFADNTRLRQVMINLVNNAIKFTEKGKIIIRVDKQSSPNVLITVKDTGSGIPPEKLDEIFVEFTQVDTSTTRKTGGTGLGLPISRRLIEMHGGRLWAESTGVPGEGSTFFVELPIEARITDVIEKTEK